MALIHGSALPCCLFGHWALGAHSSQWKLVGMGKVYIPLCYLILSCIIMYYALLPYISQFLKTVWSNYRLGADICEANGGSTR